MPELTTMFAHIVTHSEIEVSVTAVTGSYIYNFIGISFLAMLGLH